MLVLLAALASVALLAAELPRATTHGARERDVSAWTSPNARPLSDSQAAALVTRRPETRPANAVANRYVPGAAELAAFHAAQGRARRTGGLDNPLTAYVTGRSGIVHPSTDDLIQWVSHKWGIPTDWIRADMVVESDWKQSQRGDLTTVSAPHYALYPGFSRVAGSSNVYASLGIAQVKWLTDGSVGPGTEPLRWQSTAFNLDYFAATVRYYYDGYCSWCEGRYHAGQRWNSIGAWDSPQPWEDAKSRAYISVVQAALDGRAWTHLGD